MEATARYALCVGLTNLPDNEEWNVLIRVAKLLKSKFDRKKFIKIINKLNQKEPYVILDILRLISIDTEEYKHLKLCIYKNEVDGCGSGNEGNAEVHVQSQYWKLVEMDGSRP